MHVRIVLAAVVVAAVPLAGCNSGDDEPAAAASDAPTTDAGGSGGSAEADDDGGDGGGGDGDGDDAAGGGDGQGSGSASGGDRPESVSEDFPVPIMPGWEVDVHGEIGMNNVSGALVLYPNDAYDDIVAFYDEWFEAQPDEIVRSESEGMVFYQMLSDSIYQLNVLPGHEERGEIWVQVQTYGGG